MINIRILQIPPYAPPIEGGSERFCFNLSKQLIEMNHAVKVITSIRGSNEFKIIEGVPCHLQRNYWHMLQLNPLAFIHNLLPDGVDWADLVHVHSYIYFLGNQVSLYRKKRNFPFILHLHGGTSPISKEVYGFKALIAKKVYDVSLGKWGIQSADLIMSSSKNDAQNAIKIFGADPKRIVLIPNSIYVNNYFSNPSNPPIVTFLARLTQLKGCYWIPELIKRVHSEVKDAKFWIVGEGYMRKYLEDSLKGLPVKLWGGVPHSQVSEIFSKSSISYLPSYTESCPLGILESLASNVPVVSTRVGGIPEILKDGLTGFLTDVESPKKMADRIIWLLQNEKERIKMGLAGRKFVEKKHNWKNTVKIVEKIYESII